LTPPPCAQPTRDNTQILHSVELTQDNLDRILAHQIEFQGPFLPPIDSFYQSPSPIQPSSSCTVQLPSYADGVLILSTVLIGLRRDTIGLRRSSVERDFMLVANPPIGMILQSVMDRQTSHVSRSLDKWPMDKSSWVSTSRVPLDIADDSYNHFTTHFRDLGLLCDILQTAQNSPTIEPAPPSARLDAFVTQMGISSGQPVFVIYVYTEVCLLDYISQ
jgi:hypothetical protein